MTINLTFAIILAVLGMVIIPTILLLIFYNTKALKKLLIIYIVLFIVALIIGVFGTINIQSNIAEISFKFNGQWFDFNKIVVAKFGLFNTLVNLILLFSFGILLACDNHPLNWLKSLIIGLCIGLLIEIMQFILPIDRTPELMDIVFNGISMLLGYIYFVLILKIFKKGKSIKGMK